MITTVFKVANEIGKIVYNSEINKTGNGITKKIDCRLETLLTDSVSIEVYDYGVNMTYTIMMDYIYRKDKKKIYKKYLDITNNRKYDMFKKKANFNIWLDKFTYLNVSFSSSNNESANNKGIVINNTDRDDKSIFQLKWVGKNKTAYYNEFDKFQKRKRAICEKIRYNGSNGCGMTYTDMKSKRFYNSIFIEDWQLKELKDGINNFYKRKNSMNKIGITPKLCIILEGPAGTGKTSLVRALATDLNANVTRPDMSCILDSIIRSSRTIYDSSSSQEIIFLDDIDYIYIDRTDVDTKSDDKVKKNQNDFLQVLDGEESQDDTIYICTTNRYDKLDAAIKRRFNIRIQLNGIKENTAHKMAKQLCKVFSLEYNKESVNQWISQNWKTFNNYKTGKDEQYLNPKDLQNFIIYGSN